ncbi:DUF6968 family protein [Nocardia jiangxiensis]|uniref:DUF6968 family protein n=1 Tax=Nocardia jiangxiensis TaxID=282685 RepID=A0ABW6SHJ5_9NOCA
MTADEMSLNNYGEFGEPIARRELNLKATGAPVLVDLAAPRMHALGWVCPYRITGIGDEPITGSMAGVDSMQALQNGMMILDAMLQSTGAAVTFDGGDPGLKITLG